MLSAYRLVASEVTSAFIRRFEQKHVSDQSMWAPPLRVTRYHGDGHGFERALDSSALGIGSQLLRSVGRRLIPNVSPM